MLIEGNPPIHMEAVLAEIDGRPFLDMTVAIAGEVAPTFDVTFTRDVLRKAIRCACLLDKYTETGDMRYHTEFQKQRNQFYGMVPLKFHEEMRKEESAAVLFFENERILRKQIHNNGRFGWNNIEDYIRGKSSDNVFYGKILELLAPGWAPEHSVALRTQTILFDIGKDIRDYPDDVKNELPNVLYIALTTHLAPQDIPRLLPEAIRIANKTGVAPRIISIALRYKNQITPDVLSSSPTLSTALDQRFETIRRGLRPF